MAGPFSLGPFSIDEAANTKPLGDVSAGATAELLAIGLLDRDLESDGKRGWNPDTARAQIVVDIDGNRVVGWLTIDTKECPEGEGQPLAPTAKAMFESE